MRKIGVAAALVIAAAIAFVYRKAPAPGIPGTVRAVTSTPVRAAVGGEIKAMAADFGTTVKAGQVLARMDSAAFQSRVNQARADLEAARTAKAGNAIRQREALLRQAELDLERTVVRAPVDGTVVLRNADLGQTVAASSDAPPLFALADLRTIHVEAAVDGAQAGLLRRGAAVTFTAASLPRRRFAGTVLEIREGKTLMIVAPNADLSLLPGMKVEVALP